MARVRFEPGVASAAPVVFGGVPAAADTDGEGGEVGTAHGRDHIAGLHLAGRTGRAGADHHPGEVHAHDLHLGVEAMSRETERLWKAIGALAEDHGAGGFYPILQRIAPRSLSGDRVEAAPGRDRGGAEAGDAAEVLGPGATSALLPAAVQATHQHGAGPGDQSADAERAAD